MDVTVACLPGAGVGAAAETAGAHVERVALGTVALAPDRVAAVLRAHHAAIVHGTGYYTNILARLGGMHVRGCRVVNAIHTEPAAPHTYSAGPKARAAQSARTLVEAWTRSRADMAIADSRALADAVVATGADPGRVTVIHNSVDPFSLRAEATAGERPAAPKGGPLVGTLGRLEPVKGLDVLLDAVPLVAEAVPGARFLLAGGGPEREALAARVASDPVLSERVTLLGFVPSAPAFLGMLDCYCLPSRSEGFNTTILEAMALDVPVVATDVGGTREAVFDGETGRLVPSADPAALSAALIGLLADEASRLRMAEAGRALVEAEFTVARMVERTLEVDARLLERR
jgi:glycosyltransferase involved in cell wall biosynthesis